MKIKEMNEALQWLREKYAVKADGALVECDPASIGAGAELVMEDGKKVKLLPWRKERRFTELKALTVNGTLEGVSTLRFAWFSSVKSLENVLYRELDLAAFLGGSNIKSLYAVVNGKTANVIAKLFDDKSCSIEASAMLPEGREDLDKHEIIARRGVACDRTVDTQVPQASIYQFTSEGEKRYTDIDTELFGFETDEILLIRAAFAVLSQVELADEWNAIDLTLKQQISDAINSEANGKKVIYKEEK